MSNAQPDRHAAGRIERDVDTGDHPAEHIDGNSNPRPTDTEAVNVIDQHYVELCVIDLDYCQRPVSSGKMGWVCAMLLPGRSRSQTFLVALLLRDRHNPVANGIVVRRL